MNIYVGNLSWSIHDEDLREAFEAYGTVDSATILTDRDTGRSRGFGFVEMPNESEAKEAIKALNGSELGGRSMTVNEARPREERKPRRDFGGSRSGGGQRGGRGGFGNDRRGNDRRW